MTEKNTTDKMFESVPENKPAIPQFEEAKVATEAVKKDEPQTAERVESPGPKTVKRKKPGPKAGAKGKKKPGPKAGAKEKKKPGPKAGAKEKKKPGPKPGAKRKKKPGPKPGAKRGRPKVGLGIASGVQTQLNDLLRQAKAIEKQIKAKTKTLRKAEALEARAVKLMG